MTRSTASPPAAATMLAASTVGETTLLDAATTVGTTGPTTVDGLLADVAATVVATLDVDVVALAGASPSTPPTGAVAGTTTTTTRTLRGSRSRWTRQTTWLGCRAERPWVFNCPCRAYLPVT